MSDIQVQTMPAIKPGDIIAVYSAHQSAWGKPAQSYCVRRVELDGTPVSDMDFHHFLSDVVSISRKEGEDYVCIWQKENYEVEPWGKVALQAFAEQLPEETKENIASCFRECGKIWSDFCEENKKELANIFAVAVVCKAFKAVANVVKGEVS